MPGRKPLKPHAPSSHGHFFAPPPSFFLPFCSLLQKAAGASLKSNDKPAWLAVIYSQLGLIKPIVYNSDASSRAVIHLTSPVLIGPPDTHGGEKWIALGGGEHLLRSMLIPDSIAPPSGEQVLCQVSPTNLSQRTWRLGFSYYVVFLSCQEHTRRVANPPRLFLSI